MKKYIALAVIALCAAVYFNMSQTTEKPTKVKTFRIGVECDYAPNNWEEKKPSDFNAPVSNHEGYYADGYDIQIAKLAANHLGAELIVRKIKWEDLIPALQNGEIDAIFSGMLDTEERHKQIAFTNTYEVKETEYVVVVNTDSLYADAEKLTDFTGAKFLCQKDTNLYASIAQIPGAVALPAVETVPEMLRNLTSGKADATVINLDTGHSYEATYSNLKVIRFPENEGFNVGFHGICAGVRKKDTDLLNQINIMLKQLPQSERQKIMDSTISRLWKDLSSRIHKNLS